MKKLFEVTDCEFNRANYSDLIGKQYINPPSYARVKVIEGIKVIGLSYSLCVRSILANEISIDDVKYIITGTKIMTESEWDDVFNQYVKTYWKKYNPDQCLLVINELRKKNMLIQVRNYRDYKLVNPTAESATYGIWIEPKGLFERHFFRIKKALDDISDWGLNDDVLNQIDTSSQWLRLISHYNI